MLRDNQPRLEAEAKASSSFGRDGVGGPVAEPTGEGTGSSVLQPAGVGEHADEGTGEAEAAANREVDPAS